jgi:toluene monooxygenase system ferredoxin subunit
MHANRSFCVTKTAQFQPLCKQRQIVEGEMTPFDVNGTEVILLWPAGGTPKAFQGICPHQDLPLKDGYFNGHILTCPAHEWVFDGRTGEGLSPTGCALREYPTRIVDGTIEIDAAALDPFQG